MKGAPRERPAGVTILAVLFLIAGTIYAFGALIAPLNIFQPLASILINPLAAVFVFLALAISFVQGFLLIAIGIGFLKLQNWARVLLIILIGLGFLGGIRGLVTSGANGILQSPGPAFILAAISIGILMYLFSPRVKQAFGATRL